MKNVEEWDLNNPHNIRKCLKNWELIDLLSEEHIKVADIKLEIQQRLDTAPLSFDHRDALRLNLMEDKTQKDSGEIMGKAPRIVAKLVEEGCEILAKWGDYGQTTHQRTSIAR